MGATALLATQPPPAGRTVAIVSNVGGAGVLAADALHRSRAGGAPPGRADEQQAAGLIPVGGSVNGPVDTAATVSAVVFRQVLETLGADEDVHAVIALVLRTGATGDLLAAIAEAGVGVPLAVVVLNQPEAVRLVDAKGGKVPAYAYPEVAARALSRAVRYAEWRAEPRGTVPAFPDVGAERAREIVHAFLTVPVDTGHAATGHAATGHAATGHPEGGWLPRTDVMTLLGLYRIPAATAGADVPGGTEVMIGVRDDQMFGPLVVLRLAGRGTDPAGRRGARLAPLTQADADTLINSVGGVPAADLGPLRDVLLRVSRLTEDLPEVTELDLNLVIASTGRTVVMDGRIRVAAQVPQDPFLRRLR